MGVQPLSPCQSCMLQNQRHSSGNRYLWYIFWHFEKKQIQKYLKFVKREHFSGATSPKKWSHGKPASIKSTFITRMKKLVIFWTFYYWEPYWKLVCGWDHFLGGVAPKMCSHFMSFKYFLIWFFAKCQKIYFSIGFPVVWQCFRAS